MPRRTNTPRPLSQSESWRGLCVDPSHPQECHIFSADLKFWWLPDLWHFYLGKTSGPRVSPQASLALPSDAPVLPTGRAGGAGVHYCTCEANVQKCRWPVVFLFLKENLRISDMLFIISSWSKKSVTHFSKKYILKGTGKKLKKNNISSYYFCVTGSPRNEWLKREPFSCAPRSRGSGIWNRKQWGWFVFDPWDLGWLNY